MQKDEQVSLRSNFNPGQMGYSCNVLDLFRRITARGGTIIIHGQPRGCQKQAQRVWINAAAVESGLRRSPLSPQVQRSKDASRLMRQAPPVFCSRHR